MNAREVVKNERNKPFSQIWDELVKKMNFKSICPETSSPFTLYGVDRYVAEYMEKMGIGDEDLEAASRIDIETLEAAHCESTFNWFLDEDGSAWGCFYCLAEGVFGDGIRRSTGVDAPGPDSNGAQACPECRPRMGAIICGAGKYPPTRALLVAMHLRYFCDVPGAHIISTFNRAHIISTFNSLYSEEYYESIRNIRDFGLEKAKEKAMLAYKSKIQEAR